LLTGADYWRSSATVINSSCYSGGGEGGR